MAVSLTVLQMPGCADTARTLRPSFCPPSSRQRLAADLFVGQEDPGQNRPLATLRVLRESAFGSENPSQGFAPTVRRRSFRGVYARKAGAALICPFSACSLAGTAGCQSLLRP